MQHLSPYGTAVAAFTMAQASTGVVTQASDDGGAESVVAMAGDGAQNRCVVVAVTDPKRSVVAWTHTRQVDFGGGATGATGAAGSLGSAGAQPTQPGPTAPTLSVRVNVPTCSIGGCPRMTMHLDTLDAAAVASCVLNSTAGKYVAFRLNFHQFDRFELDLRGHAHV